MKTHWGGGEGTAPRILNLGSRWWVVSFTPLPLYPVRYETGFAPEPAWTQWQREKSHHCPHRESNPGHPTRSL